VSTSISVRGFRDARSAAVSSGRRQYLGLGQNAPVSQAVKASYTRSATGAAGPECSWPLDEWNRPIAATELRQAASLLGPAGTEVVTGAAFTDTAIMARSDLGDYKVLHFATHGLVTPPRSGCPARPALLTSFGAAESDGLLNFNEIFDLRLDADLVILSACDTAGEASREATRAAGLSTGGGTALDGLVRAFIGAGGRAVIASHWPAPDDYNATQRLIGGLFSNGAGEPTAIALQKAQAPLMDDPETSHPFYWSGFAIVGDGARPLPGR
jgi:CHAT domain-containing protein